MNKNKEKSIKLRLSDRYEISFSNGEFTLRDFIAKSGDPMLDEDGNHKLDKNGNKRYYASDFYKPTYHATLLYVCKHISEQEFGEALMDHGVRELAERFDNLIKKPLDDRYEKLRIWANNFELIDRHLKSKSRKKTGE